MSGTIYGCAMTIAKSMLGAGMLSLPFAYAQTGQTLGTCLLFISGTLCINC